MILRPLKACLGFIIHPIILMLIKFSIKNNIRKWEMLKNALKYWFKNYF